MKQPKTLESDNISKLDFDAQKVPSKFLGIRRASNTYVRAPGGG